MNTDIFWGKVKQFIWDIQQQWSELTDDDIWEITNKEQLIWKLQERYWYAKEEAEEHADNFAKKYL